MDFISLRVLDPNKRTLWICKFLKMWHWLWVFFSFPFFFWWQETSRLSTPWWKSSQTWWQDLHLSSKFWESESLCCMFFFFFPDFNHVTVERICKKGKRWTRCTLSCDKRTSITYTKCICLPSRFCHIQSTATHSDCPPWIQLHAWPDFSRSTWLCTYNMVNCTKTTECLDMPEKSEDARRQRIRVRAGMLSFALWFYPD